jgi:hypothetical protein
MGRTLLLCIGAPHTSWTGFSKPHNPLIYRWNKPRIRHGPQSQNRECDRVDDPGFDPCPRRQGDRLDEQPRTHLLHCMCRLVALSGHEANSSSMMGIGGPLADSGSTGSSQRRQPQRRPRRNRSPLAQQHDRRLIPSYFARNERRRRSIVSDCY